MWRLDGRGAANKTRNGHGLGLGQTLRHLSMAVSARVRVCVCLQAAISSVIGPVPLGFDATLKLGVTIY